MEEGHSSNLHKYLITAFPRADIKKDKQSWLKFDKTGTLIYVNGSKRHDAGAGWYDLDESIYNTLMSADNAYQAIVLGEPGTTFVLSKQVVQDIFSSQPKLQREGKSDRWMFSIFENSSKYHLVLGGDAKYDITEYLNKWDLIPELSNSDGSLSFVKLQRFLLNDMQMEANYQPIMIKTLLERRGRATRGEIAEKISEFNKDIIAQDFRYVPVYEVLEKHGIVRKESDRFVLNMDQITPDEKDQLIVLCNWKIPNSPLNLEELIEGFNSNMNLFDPDGYDSSKRQIDHKAFVTRFPSDNIMDMLLDEYVAGKPDPQTGKTNKSTFCYLLEFGLPSFGGIGGRQASKFGIYYSVNSNDYVYKKKYTSPQEAFSHIKKEINTMLEAAKQFRSHSDWKKFSNSVEEGDYDLYRNVRSKIITVYFPDEFLNMHVPDLIDAALSAFGEKEVDTDRLYLKEERLMQLKKNHPIMSQWDNAQFSHFVWNAIIKRENKIKNSGPIDSELESMTTNEDPHIFVTGYDERNLDISTERGILGWANKSNFLTVGSLVFVFNKDSLLLETCFEIKSQSSDKNLIWEDEKSTGRIIYGNRWNAEVLYDDLDIPLQEINSIPPFDKEKFQGLLRGNFPMPLDTPSNYDKYTQFRIKLLGKINSVPNYWIFVVADQPKLSAKDIYRTRMEDKFWGINKRTSYRKSLKGGDKVIFSHGARSFLGTATLDSTSFELDSTQKRELTHNSDIFRTDYGVFLKDVQSWQTPKQVHPYVPSLSFISNESQYPVYFQGGVKKITAKDYTMIASTNDTTVATEQESPEDAFEDAPLNEPDTTRIEEALRQIDEKLLIDKESIMQIVVNLLSGRHVIIAGPVGTGKTTLAYIISQLFWQDSNFDGYLSDIYTATADWNSQDVIGGIMPRIKNDKPTYEMVLGCVSNTVQRNWSKSLPGSRKSTALDNKKYKGVWLVIDEFNRADIDKALGQLFTALETRILKVPVMNSITGYEEWKIPLDYRIIGTLNTADKHYLFKLSDALKRRFAYVEISPPRRNLKNTEIYYALKNALDELDKSYSDSLIVLDQSNKNIDLNKSDKTLLQIIDQAYEILDFVRITKPLGTAILKSIYKTILVGIRITNDPESSLDIAINSNLIPQLETVGVTSLETIFNLLFGDSIAFFMEKHNSNERDQYQYDFRNFLGLIGAKNPEDKVKQFLLQISPEVWNSIKEDYLPNKISLQCTLFKTSLLELIKSSMT